ncbi:MAG: hypothetical protein ACRECT_00810 [Thermoplasmata archaeon]
MLRLDGPVVSPSVYPPSTFVDLEDSVAWWSALSTLGALLAGAGVLLGAGAGEAVAIGGVALFFATAVSAGLELIEAGTALGVAAVVWTAGGIAAALGTDPSPTGSLVGLGGVGVVLVIVGALGARRAGQRAR